MLYVVTSSLTTGGTSIHGVVGVFDNEADANHYCDLAYDKFAEIADGFADLGIEADWSAQVTPAEIGKVAAAYA